MVALKHVAVVVTAVLLIEALHIQVAAATNLRADLRFGTSRRTLKTATAQLYQACGGLGSNNVPGGVTPVDDCWATCPSGATCYRQNAFFWQCLNEDPCSRPGWECGSKKCGSVVPGGPPTPPAPPLPPSPPDNSGNTPPLPPLAPRPPTRPPQPKVPPVTPAPPRPVDVPPPTDILPEFAKCGNEIQFYNVDFCQTGLRCTRKDKFFMQCMKKTEDTELDVYAKGDTCGQASPYDLGGTVKICPVGTACMTETGDGTWKCLESGYYSTKIVTKGQCYAPSEDRACTESGSFCAAYDDFYGGCIQRAEWKRLDEGATCGVGAPYSGDYGNSFCPLDKPCVPKSDFWSDTVIGVPIEFICSGEEVNLEEGVTCGNEFGPFNGYFTCSGNGGLTDGNVANLCVQEKDSAWRCRKGSLFGYVSDDDELCGKGAPYYFPDAPDVSVFCSGATSSCWLFDYETATYACAPGRCPNDWDCQSTVILPKAGNPVVKYCGPFSQTPGWLEAIGGIFISPVTTCDEGSVCVLKDSYGIFQCEPWAG